MPQANVSTRPNHLETANTLQELSRRGFGSIPYLYAEIRAGRLRVRKFGRATRVLESDLQEWLVRLPMGVDNGIGAPLLGGGAND